MSIQFSFGNEEEFLLLANNQPFVMPLPQLLATPGCPAGQWSHEAHQGMLEHATPICYSLQSLYQHILQSRRFLADLASSMQVQLYCGGTHPQLDWPALQMTATYQAVVDEYQDTVKALTLFGMHTHIGINDNALLVQVFNALRPYLAPLLALSANSPFYRGRDTGLSSYRAMQFLLMPRTGTPPISVRRSACRRSCRRTPLSMFSVFWSKPTSNRGFQVFSPRFWCPIWTSCVMSSTPSPRSAAR